MRETRQSGSEGGATELNQSFLPLSFGCGYAAPFIPHAAMRETFSNC